MTEPVEPRTLVIGCGNTLRGDDGAGPRVAQAVARRGWPGVDVVAVHQLTPELAERLAQVDRVVFVDARLSLSPEETFAFHPVAPRGNGTSDAHTCDIESLLALAAQLYGRSPTAHLLTIPAVDLGFGESLSPTARRGCAEAFKALAARFRPRANKRTAVQAEPRSAHR